MTREMRDWRSGQTLDELESSPPMRDEMAERIRLALHVATGKAWRVTEADSRVYRNWGYIHIDAPKDLADPREAESAYPLFAELERLRKELWEEWGPKPWAQYYTFGWHSSSTNWGWIFEMEEWNLAVFVIEEYARHIAGPANTAGLGRRDT